MPGGLDVYRLATTAWRNSGASAWAFARYLLATSFASAPSSSGILESRSDVPARSAIHLDYRYRFFFLKTAAGVILRALARGQGNMGRRIYTRIETGLTIPAYMSATCTISCGFYKAHRTEKPVLGTLTVDRTSCFPAAVYDSIWGPSQWRMGSPLEFG